jgi:prephenate dehydratase
MAKVARGVYFKAVLEDKPGALLKVMQDLKAKNIALSGLWGFGTSQGKAHLYAIPKNPEKLRNAWKASGLLAEEGTGFWIKGADRTGALNQSLEALASAGVNIGAIHAIAVGGQFGSFLWVSAEDVNKAAQALGAR